MSWIFSPLLVITTCGGDLLASTIPFFFHLAFPMAFIILFGIIISKLASKCGLVTYSVLRNFNIALLWDILAMYLASNNSTQYIVVNSYLWTHSRVYMNNNQHVFWLFRLEEFFINLHKINMRLTCGLAYVNLLILDDLDIVAMKHAQHIFKAWLPFLGIYIFKASPSDGPASRTQSKVHITSHPPTPSPRVSQEGVLETPCGHSKTGIKPLGKAYLVSNEGALPSSSSYLQVNVRPSQFINPEPAISVPKMVVPESLRLRDDDYYTAMADSLAAPSQDDIKEHQTFLVNIYKIIEGKLEEEQGIFLASDMEIPDEKWSPLVPDTDILSADIINQEVGTDSLTCRIFERTSKT
ncbi:hypothetical protein AX15_005273 [Amanita polypyramis BW_CC]|nr:hypothetical protein AX15_005273 [Amanita polypyramis BW_CC]